MKKLSADLNQDWRLLFDSSLSLDDIGPTVESLLDLAFLNTVPKSGKWTSALNFCRGERVLNGRDLVMEALNSVHAVTCLITRYVLSGQPKSRSSNLSTSTRIQAIVFWCMKMW